MGKEAGSRDGQGPGRHDVGNYPWYLDVRSSPWEAYRSATFVTVDLETTNRSRGSACEVGNRIVDAACQVNAGPVIVGLDNVKATLAGLAAPVVLVAHNAKFELQWLKREGVECTALLVWDTMIAEYVLAGNRRWPLDLGSVTARYGLTGKNRLVDRLMRAGVCPSEMPAHMVRERVVGDVRSATALFLLQRDRVEAAGLTRVMFTRAIATPVLAEMEQAGMLLDASSVEKEYETLLKRRSDLSIQLGTMTGGINLRSRPQLATFLYSTLKFKELTDRRGNFLRTGGGQPLTDSETLDALKASTDAQREFVKLRAEYGKVDAALTKNLEFFQKVCKEHSARFSATFNQTRTATHRLSSSGKPLTFSDNSLRGVQFQNLPRAYKRLFVAPAGSLMVEADGAQLEFRVGGSLARDPVILRDAMTGADVHRFTASVINRIDESAVTSKQRTAAKSHTFKPMYGGTSGTPREREYYEAFRTKYKDLYRMQMNWVHTVLAEKQLRTATGLMFYWPDTKMQHGGYIENTSSIFNYPIQSLATAEIIPVSLVYLFWGIRAAGLTARLVNTVHDSVVAEVPEKELDRYKQVVIESFLKQTYQYMSVVYGLDLYVPLGVSIKAGRHWGEGEEETHSYGNQGAHSGKG